MSASHWKAYLGYGSVYDPLISVLLPQASTNLICPIILGNFFPKQEDLLISFQLLIHTLIYSITNCHLSQVGRTVNKLHDCLGYYGDSLPL